MAKKQAVLDPTSASGAAPARAAKPAASRTRTGKHSKAIIAEKPVATTSPVIIAPSVDEEPTISEIVSTVEAENPLTVISQLAYGYWEARGCQGGDQLEDWVRAEEEYRRRIG